MDQRNDDGQTGSGVGSVRGRSVADGQSSFANTATGDRTGVTDHEGR